MPINGIVKFEKRNGIRVNVYSLNNSQKKVTLLHLSDFQAPRTVNLLLYKNHYSPITKLSRLLTSQLSSKNSKRYYCEQCLYSTCSKSVLLKHVCTRSGNQFFLYPVLEVEISFSCI